MSVYFYMRSGPWASCYFIKNPIPIWHHLFLYSSYYYYLFIHFSISYMHHNYNLTQRNRHSCLSSDMYFALLADLSWKLCEFFCRFSCVKFKHFNLLLQNHFAKFNENWSMSCLGIDLYMLKWRSYLHLGPNKGGFAENFQNNDILWM